MNSYVKNDDYQQKMDALITKKLQEVFQDPALHFDRSRFAGGLTNYNYIMSIQGNDYIIRQPGMLTEQMIDRHMEQTNTAIVSKLGITSTCIYFDAETGIKISAFVPASKNLAQSNPFSSESLLAVSTIMKEVHRTPVTFENCFDWKQELEKYEGIIASINGALFFDYRSLKKKIFAFFDTYVHELECVSCHNDTVPENFLISDESDYYLIDWEYSGLNDPTFDLAAFIIETRLPKEAIDELLFHYYGEECPDAAIKKIKAFIMAQDLLWTVWALIRHYCGDNFLDYCDMRYERFRKNILALSKDPDYPLYKMVH